MDTEYHHTTHACMPLNLVGYIHKYKHVLSLDRTRTFNRAQTHISSNTNKHNHIHPTYRHSLSHIHVHTHTHSQTLTLTNTHTHIFINVYTQEEIDKKTVLRANWKRLLKQSETRTEELSKTQTKFKRLLLKDIKDFKVSYTDSAVPLLWCGVVWRGAV